MCSPCMSHSTIIHFLEKANYISSFCSVAIPTITLYNGELNAVGSVIPFKYQRQRNKLMQKLQLFPQLLSWTGCLLKYNKHFLPNKAA